MNVRLHTRTERGPQGERRVIVMWIGERAFTWRIPRARSLLGGLAGLFRRERG